MTQYSYTCLNSQSDLMIAEWAFSSHEACCTDVLPDGCCDIILEKPVGQAPTLFVSELGESAYTVSTPAGTSIQGMRLHPGVQIRQAEMRSWLEGKNPAEIFDVDQLSEFCVKSDNLSSALACLESDKQSVQNAAKELGVSLRTLERLVKSGTGRTPYFWFSLARIRRTARSLYGAKSLGEAALDAGFTDQSHMNREMNRWFGKTPAQIAKDDYIRSILLEAGYG